VRAVRGDSLSLILVIVVLLCFTLAHYIWLLEMVVLDDMHRIDVDVMCREGESHFFFYLDRENTEQEP
jgi:hypothetical protein